MILSNTKFLIVSFDLLAPVKTYRFITPNHTKVFWRLLYDSTTVYLGQSHIPYAALALLILFVFVLIPILLLLFYPMVLFQKILNRLPYRFQIYLDTFVDLFQGCYKNGTQPGTRDCRWFSAVPFILRLVLLVLYTVTLDTSFTPYAAQVTALMIILIDPYKSQCSSSFTMFVFFLACYSTILTAFNVQQWYWLLVSTWIVLAMPFFYISALTLSLINSHKMSGFQFSIKHY